MVLLVDLSELFIRGIPAMHERVAAVYGADVASWFRKRKERMNPIFLDLMRGESTLTAYWEIFCEDSDRPNNVRASNLQNLFCDELKEKSLVREKSSRASLRTRVPSGERKEISSKDGQKSSWFLIIFASA